MAAKETFYYYRTGDTAFYTVHGADGVMSAAFRFDRASGAYVSDLAGATRRLFVAPEETDQIERAEFHALVKSQGGEGAP